MVNDSIESIDKITKEILEISKYINDDNIINELIKIIEVL